MESVSIVLSTLALAVSMVTAWLTLFRRGTLHMTQPAVIFFGPNINGVSQIYLRTLLYSTGRRGQLVENMFVKVRHGESVQNLNIREYGEVGRLVRGSGLFVPQEGVAFDHHFLLPPGATFEFLAGEYQLETCASLVGKTTSLVLNKVALTVDSQQAGSIKAGQGLFFEWGPDSRKYHPHVGKRPEPSMPPRLV